VRRDKVPAGVALAPASELIDGRAKPDGRDHVLKHAPGGPTYLTADDATLTKGKMRVLALGMTCV